MAKQKRKPKPKLTEHQWREIYILRCRAKRGEYISPEVMALFARALKEDPKRYGDMTKPVFEATKPFGAQ